MNALEFVDAVAAVARRIVDLNSDPEDNPEYFRGQLELAAAGLPGEPDTMFELLDLLVRHAYEAEQIKHFGVVK